jgi:hypothetical protein
MPEMRAYLAEQKVWYIVSGKDTKPSDTAQAVVWHDKAVTAAGAIYRALEPGQRVHVVGVEMDPVKMWEKLAAVHVQKVSSVCFNALDALLAVRKSTDESLPSVVTQVDSLLQDLKALRPEGYTMDNLNDDLSAMAMICALGPKYTKFASSLVCFDPTRSEVVQAFICKHNHCLPHAGGADSAAYCAQGPPLSSSTLDAVCNFCSFKGHLEATCHRRAAARDQACKDIAERKAGHRTECPQAANVVSTASGLSESVQSARQAYSVELAGNASTSSSPEPLPAALAVSSTDWTADTGATAHMTPHRHWFASYTPCNVPICLTNSKLVYAVGIGSVRFQLVVEGCQSRVVEFTRVLHVPKLHSNLLSVLYLTQHKATVTQKT